MNFQILNSMASMKQPYLSTLQVFLISTQRKTSTMRILVVGFSFSHSEGANGNGVTHCLMNPFTLSNNFLYICVMILISIIIKIYARKFLICEKHLMNPFRIITIMSSIFALNFLKIMFIGIFW